MIPGLDISALPSSEREDIERLARLYLLVLGRPPDRDGLVTYLQHLRNGVPLHSLAADFLASPEFRSKAEGRDARAVLLERAGNGSKEADLPLLAAALVDQPEVKHRFPVLPALYPHGAPSSPEDYRTWLAFPPEPDASPSGKPPRLSFVILSGEPDPACLKAAIASTTLAETNGEVLVVTPRRAALRLYWQLRGLSKVRVLVSPAKWDEARLFNYALARCRGEFVACLGQRDVFRPVEGLEEAFHGADALLLDGDRLDERGRRAAPRFGAAFDPDRIMAAGFDGLTFFRVATLRSIGGLHPGEAAEDASLLLALAAVAGEGGIRHLSAVGVSRRAEDAMALNRRVPAVRRFLGAVRPSSALRLEDGSIRITEPLPEPLPGVAVVIPTRDHAKLLRRCTTGLLTRTDYPALSVLVVDNGSTEPEALALLRKLEEDPRVTVLRRPGPFNWASLNNEGVAATDAPVLLLLNNDIDVLNPNWLRAMVSLTCRLDVGAVGAKLLYPDGSVQHAGITMIPTGHALHLWRGADPDDAMVAADMAVTHRVAAVTGACLAIRRDVYVAVGGCDVVNLPVTWNDIDLCLRVREHGLQVLWTPEACLMHLEQATRGSDNTPENDARFRREQAYMECRWGAAVCEDPFWSPNLRPDGGGMRLAVPAVCRISSAGWDSVAQKSSGVVVPGITP